MTYVVVLGSIQLTQHVDTVICVCSFGLWPRCSPAKWTIIISICIVMYQHGQA